MPAQSSPLPDSLGKQLLLAVWNNDIDRVTACINAGAPVDFYSAEDEPLPTALHLAVQRRYYAIARRLLALGADTGIANDEGRTPLFYVGDDVPIAEQLLDYGADPNAQDKLGQGVLRHIIQVSALNSSVFELLRAGADPLHEWENEIPRQRILPLYATAIDVCKAYEALPRVTVDATLTKADLFRKDEKGQSALCNPVTWRQWEHITGILDARGEVITKAELLGGDFAKGTCLTVAAHARKLDAVVRYLNAHGETLQPMELGKYRDISALMEERHVPAALFTRENMLPCGLESYQRNLAWLPEKSRDSVTNRYRLWRELQQEESCGVGR